MPQHGRSAKVSSLFLVYFALAIVVCTSFGNVTICCLEAQRVIIQGFGDRRGVNDEIVERMIQSLVNLRSPGFKMRDKF